MSRPATRNKILDALQAFIATGMVATVNTVQRRVKMRSALSPSDFPAIFIRHVADEYAAPTAYGMPSILTMKIELFLFDRQDVNDPDAIPSANGESLLDAIEALFSPTSQDEFQTLGGLVHYVVLSGEAPIDSGDISGDLTALIPLKILVP